MDRAETVAAALHYAEGTIAPVAFHPDGCGTCARAVDLVDQIDRTYPVDEDPMPVFVIKGKDRLALAAVHSYFLLCLGRGLTSQAAEVSAAEREILEWQGRHRDQVKSPDHLHVPVTKGNPGV
jgi:hypothetical protein